MALPELPHQEIDKYTGELLPPIPGVQITTTALIFDDTFDQWPALGDRIERVHGGVMWWIGDWWVYGEHKYGERVALTSKSSQYQTRKNAGWVARRFERSRRRDLLTWGHHAEVAALDVVDQDDLLDKAETGMWSVAELRQAVRGYKRGVKVAEIVRRHSGDPSTLGSFPVIYADPPWRYDFAVDETTRAVENHYPTMGLEEIAGLNVPAADDGVLFLWATSPKVPEALIVLTAWGYEYRTCMVWVKDRIGMGYYARQQHELLLIGARGDIPAPAPSTRPPSVITAPRTEHSTKPHEVYGLIEAMYPDYPKCELFQREPRDGWVGWGNQIEASA
jgi:N6-adenosine-specific RNA methylase IME4